jgi:hypothetical protein
MKRSLQFQSENDSRAETPSKTMPSLGLARRLSQRQHSRGSDPIIEIGFNPLFLGVSAPLRELNFRIGVQWAVVEERFDPCGVSRAPQF